jgi:hypothetical protein
MQKSKIFLSSSRYESFGLAANEAILCGCVPQDALKMPIFSPTRQIIPNTSTLAPRCVAQAILGILALRDGY